MIKRPVPGELAKPQIGLGANASAFASVLAPDDTILTSKAGGNYQVYKEVLRDDQCASTFGQRRLSVICREWQVDPASESAEDKAAAEFIKAQLAALDWDDITDQMLYARWYGHAVGECIWGVKDNQVILEDIKVRDRGRFAYDENHQLYLLNQMRYEPMPERKFWTISTGADHHDSPYGLGLAHYCYWPVFFKRNGIKFWLVFLEKFGMPTAKGVIPAGMLEDVAFRDKALEALKAIASETAILVPEGMEIELLEAARSGTGTYDTMTQAMDAAIAKLVVGQTASSQGTPGRLGNDQLQSDVRDDIVKADADLVCSSFNRQVVRWLTEWNFPNATPPKVWRVIEPPDDLNQRATRDKDIFALGFEPTEEYITETYGPGWKKKAAQQGIDPNQVPGQMAAEFAELGALAALKTGHRADQVALADAAQMFASNYEGVIGQRVQELLDLAETTGDYETFGKRLREMMAEPPKGDSTRSVLSGNFFARVLGRFRQQRDDAKMAASFAEAVARDDARHQELLAALEKPTTAPVINVAPPSVTVTVQKGATTTQTVERDESGNIARITTREE
jgi:phage gp29-like protein